MKWRALSFLFFASGVALVTAALMARSRVEPPRRPAATIFYYEVPSRRAIDFFVEGTPRQLRIHTMVLAPPNCLPEGPVPYHIDILWLDRENVKRRQTVLSEQTRFPRYPALASGPLRHAQIPHDDRDVAQERINFVPVHGVLPQGGTIRITLRARGAPVLLRVFAEEPRNKLAMERLLVSPGRLVRESVERRSGLSSWSLLAPAERPYLLAGRWTRLEIRGRVARELKAHRVKLREVRVGWQARHVSRLYLDAGQSMAVNLRGPIKVRLSGDEMITKLGVDVVADLPLGTKPRLREEQAKPVGFAMEKQARWIILEDAAALTLQLHNHHPSRRARFFLSVDRLKPSQLFANTPVLWFSDLVSNTTRATALIGPGRRVLGAYLLGPSHKHPLVISTQGFRGTQVLALSARPIRSSASSKALSRLRVVARDHHRKVLWQREVEIPFEVSRYERLAAASSGGFDFKSACASATKPNESARWLGEPQDLYLAGGEGMATIEVWGLSPLLVSVRARGADEEHESFHPVKNEGVRLRYDYRLRDRWEALRAMNHDTLRLAKQRMRFLANTRLAPPHAAHLPKRNPGARLYTTLKPLGRPTGSIWLTPMKAQPPKTQHPQVTMGTASIDTGRNDKPDLRNLYCRYPGSWRTLRFNYTPTAASRLRHVLYGVMTCPGPYLGAPFSVSLDGRRWRQGRILQQVTRFSSVRAKPRRNLEFKGPPACTLWMKSYGSERVCGAPFRPIVGYALPPGGQLSFAARKTLDEQFFVVGGVGAAGGEVHIEVSGDLRRKGGVFSAYTRSTRRVALPRLAVRAERLERPGAPTPLLEPHGIRLNPDLPSRVYRLRVVNVGGRPLHIWALWQTVSKTGEAPASKVHWVHGSGEEL
ncbi:MAG: hypothetical protein JRH20_14885 [Deltaproteobacteria bacterium]|nr:hypothetical protein [Deltaproteobacteria bacterium]